ncbi:MAG: hypothetical protein KDK56_02655 [Simkania sp.]|nr:hypothetical protein [Simkania sp.]
MKRFLLIMVSFFSLQSMTCYADPYPTIHFYYSLVLNEDLFAQADENMKIITSADYTQATAKIGFGQRISFRNSSILSDPILGNMRSLKIGKLRRFGAAENPIFAVA